MTFISRRMLSRHCSWCISVSLFGELLSGVKRMKIQTYTVVVGDRTCNAQCPYCISCMTPSYGLATPSMRNFRIGCELARDYGASTMFLTGKGEPTLHPCEIEEYVMLGRKYGFPLIELQTNGILIAEIDSDPETLGFLERWYEKGLTTVSLSIAHHNNAVNSRLLRPNGEPYDIWKAVDILHERGFSVRISCMMMLAYVASGYGVEELMRVCKEHDVEQVTVRGIDRPDVTRNNEKAKWIDDHYLEHVNRDVRKHIEATNGIKLLELPHGGIVYDWNGQSAAFVPSARYAPPGALDVSVGIQTFTGPRRSQYGSAGTLGPSPRGNIGSQDAKCQADANLRPCMQPSS